MWRKVAAAAMILGAGHAWAESAVDAYAPLALYDGAWTLKPTTGATVSIVDRCRRMTTFFACEQTVDGKIAGLLLFVPAPSNDRVFHYRTQFLHPDLTPAGAGSTLTIDGNDWVYADPKAPGATPWIRTLNRFYGHDRIHFARQSSADGRTWTTIAEGEEARVTAR